MPALPSTIESRHIDDVTPPPMIASSPSSSASSSASSSTSSPPAPRMTSPPNVATATCYLPESRLISRSIVSTRYPEEIEETARSNSASTGSTGSSKSADARPRQSLSKSSASLRSLVRRKSRRQVGGSATVSGGSSSIIESNNDSRHSRHQGSEDGLHRRRESTGGEEETTMYTSGRSSARRASSVVRGTMVAGIVGGQDNNNIGQDASSSISNVVFVAPTVVSNANRFVRTTSSSLVRATSVPTTPGPSTSNSSSHWNNSSEQETDYVVDPVQGKAYYKGQFLGRGGFARVYLMTDVSDGNQYACKIIPKNRMQKIHMQKVRTRRPPFFHRMRPPRFMCSTWVHSKMDS